MNEIEELRNRVASLEGFLEIEGYDYRYNGQGSYSFEPKTMIESVCLTTDPQKSSESPQVASMSTGLSKAIKQLDDAIHNGDLRPDDWVNDLEMYAMKVVDLWKSQSKPTESPTYRLRTELVEKIKSDITYAQRTLAERRMEVMCPHCETDTWKVVKALDHLLAGLEQVNLDRLCLTAESHNTKFTESDADNFIEQNKELFQDLANGSGLSDPHNTNPAKRCKHDVFMFDHCYECERESGSGPLSEVASPEPKETQLTSELSDATKLRLAKHAVHKLKKDLAAARAEIDEHNRTIGFLRNREARLTVLDEDGRKIIFELKSKIGRAKTLIQQAIDAEMSDFDAKEFLAELDASSALREEGE